MTQLTDRQVKTRKLHACWGCAREFPAGSVMRYTTTADGGKLSSAYWCTSCCDKINKMDSWQREDGFSFGDLAAE